MINFFKKNQLNIILVLFVISVLPFFGKLFETKHEKHINDELFRSEFSYLNSVEKVTDSVGSIFYTSDCKKLDTALYVQIVSETIKQRFAYGLQHYEISENWIAVLASKLFWSHFSALVNPDEILKHSKGLCS